VQSATLTVYSGPSTSGMVLASLTAGTDVTVLQTLKQWDQVTLPDGTVGWVDGSGLSAATSQNTSQSSGTAQHATTPRARVQQVKGFHATRAARATSRQATVTADVLFVRAGPSTHARILRRVHAGDRLHILRTKHGWDYVSLHDGNRGWVSGHWIRVAKRAA
jgi:N-acetylmuramoyl-L-alanine amidase